MIRISEKAHKLLIDEEVQDTDIARLKVLIAQRRPIEDSGTVTNSDKKSVK